jgi:hypothetical protein
VALPLLTCFAFTEGPLHGGITLAGLTRRQHNVVHALLDSGAFDCWVEFVKAAGRLAGS